MVIENGVITDSGSHSELLGKAKNTACFTKRSLKR